MTLAKLIITPLTFPELQRREAERIKVPFNPNSYRIQKEVTWTNRSELPTGTIAQSAPTLRELNAPPLVFGGGDSRLLTLELFFDVTEPIDGVFIDDVRQETNKIVKLTRIERDTTKQPPVCEISWGDNPPKHSDFPFRGVVTSLSQHFTLFRNDGKPVRANLTVTFKEFLVPEEDLRQTDPELTTRIVKRGDTLSSIAAEMYSDPTLWRAIAQANRLDDPRQLQSGQSLTIPKLR